MSDKTIEVLRERLHSCYEENAGLRTALKNIGKTVESLQWSMVRLSKQLDSCRDEHRRLIAEDERMRTALKAIIGFSGKSDIYNLARINIIAKEVLNWVESPDER